MNKIFFLNKIKKYILSIINYHNLFFRYALLILCLLFSNKSYATNFTKSCTSLPPVDDISYLVSDTAYGYIRSFLGMKDEVTNSCLAQGVGIKFCIRSGGSTSTCEEKTINIGTTSPLSSLTSNPSLRIPMIDDIGLSAENIGHLSCITMPTSKGSAPLLCREKELVSVADVQLREICKSFSKSCYESKKYSKSLLNFSGVTIACLRKTIDKLFYVGSECETFSQYSNVEHHSLLRPFPHFQDYMKKAITAALIIYVIFYGFKLVTNIEYANLNQVALFVIKFILVFYFSVGFTSNTFEYGKFVKHNGMTELALPMLVDFTSSFTGMIFSAAGSVGATAGADRLCDFSNSAYEPGYEYFKIWDAIDCRIGYYLGMRALYNFGSAIGGAATAGSNIGTGASNAASGAQSTANANSASGVVSGVNTTVQGVNEVLQGAEYLAFFVVMFGFFLSGNILIVLISLVFVVMLISVMFYFLTAYLVCIVTLYVMAYISVIFIPLALFERTKMYFDSWLRVVISCALQPAIIGGFIALLITLYDISIFGNCEFKRRDYTAGELSYSTFELTLPAADIDKCEASAGYKLNKYYSGVGAENKNFLLFEAQTYVDVLGLYLSLTYLMVYLFLFYFFVQYISDFASDLSGGAPNLRGVTVSPTELFDRVKEGAYKAAMLARAAARAQAGDTQGAAQDAQKATESDEEGGGEKKAKRTEATDKFSSGGGSGGSS